MAHQAGGYNSPAARALEVDDEALTAVPVTTSRVGVFEGQATGSGSHSRAVPLGRGASPRQGDGLSSSTAVRAAALSVYQVASITV